MTSFSWIVICVVLFILGLGVGALITTFGDHDLDDEDDR